MKGAQSSPEAAQPRPKRGGLYLRSIRFSDSAKSICNLSFQIDGLIGEGDKRLA